MPKARHARVWKKHTIDVEGSPPPVNSLGILKFIRMREYFNWEIILFSTPQIHLFQIYYLKDVENFLKS